MQTRFFLLILCLMLAMPLSAQGDNSESDLIVYQDHFYTYHQATGNRFVNGSGTFPDVTVNDYTFESDLAWLIGGNQNNNLNIPLSVLAVHQANGTVQIMDTLSGELDSTTGVSSPEQAISLYEWRGGWAFINSQQENMTNPTFVADQTIADIDAEGRLILAGSMSDSLDLNIQSDAKIVLSDDGRIAVYANATNQRYVHGIMGDSIEGASLVILRIVDEKLEIIEQIDLEGDAVYEGLSPMWADVNQDGVQDLITTVSDSNVGSRIRAYLFTDNGIVTVEGQAIGRPGRWQHQLAWGSFGANGEMQLVEVLTPHIGGVVRFYEFTGTELSIVSQLGGYTSHVIGSRNLDMAVAGDFDGDGQPEIVLPSQDRSRIAGIANTATGAEVVWELSLDGTLVTNLAAINTANGLALAAGRSDGTVRLWLSQS